MENKAKIEYRKAKNRLNDSIVITFQKRPDVQIQKDLFANNLIPDNTHKKWKTTVGALGENTYEYFFNRLIKTGLLSGDAEGLGALGSPYIPASFVCPLLNTITPDSMDYEIHIAVRKIKQETGDFTKFIMKKLHYSREELCHSLSAEQIDAVVLSIYNIEKRKQGMIIGDQTGIGKGRVAGAMIRYARLAGLRPIFLSEKPNLFSDIYRDLADIGSASLVPFIVNGRESKTHVKDPDGNVVYEALPKTEQDTILKSKKLPAKYDYVLATYSQFNSPQKKFVKPDFLTAIAKNNILIMDEAHNASGSSNTGEFMQKVIAETKGVTFLSATFAKRPDNMPIYAMKTAMSETNMTNEQLVEAIKNGGVALQEILSSQLVAEGQMIRRERSFEGVEVNYITLTEKAEEHGAISDNITEVIRDIIEFQDKYIKPEIQSMDEIMAADYAETEQRKGTNNAGVDMPPMFSKVFNLINQMLFSIKAKSVAERAIMRLQEGKKPIIAFASTMGSFLEQMTNENGQVVSNGDKIKNDFKEVLIRALRGVMRYTVTTPADDTDPDDYENVKNKPKSAYNREYKYFDISELTPEAQQAYHAIVNKIERATTGISISPIDDIINHIEQAGYTVGEVTGRKMEVKPVKGEPGRGLVMTRKRINVNDAFRKFNNNEVDCLMINQSGATGASAHAIVTNNVPAEQVKQRVMIILQAELDISKEVQKRGRINRTGQLFLPIYDYVNSAIPAEQRLMMMLKKKLKSLDANTTSNQKQTSAMLDSGDFLNKYGDKIVTYYLKENTKLVKKLGDPLKFDSDNKPTGDDKVEIMEGAAHKVSGRVAILSVAEQDKFYKDIFDRYNKYVEYLKQTDQYDLEVETMNLAAETKEKTVSIAGKGGESSFAKDSVMEKCMVNNLRKPFTKDELNNLIKNNLKEGDAETLQNTLIQEHKDFLLSALEKQKEAIKQAYKEKIDNITNEKKYQKLANEAEKQQFYDDRLAELNTAMERSIEKEKDRANNRYRHLNNIFSFFRIGEGYDWPQESTIPGEQSVKCVFLGYGIDKKRDNPYAPSAVQLRFAVANSIKYITLSASGEQGERIQTVIGLSHRLSSFERKEIIENWDNYTRQFAADKVIRFIVTGNILQAFSQFKGKLISYTTTDQSVRKGIFMPSGFDPERKDGSDMVTIPIGKAKKVIAGLSQGRSVYDKDKKIGISKGWNAYLFTMPKSKNFKRIYTDPDVIYLTEDKRDGFNMQSGMMKAYVSDENMPKLIDVLQGKYNLNILVSNTVYDQFVEKTISVNVKPEKIKKAEKVYKADKVIFENKIKQRDKKPDDVEKEAESKIKEAEKHRRALAIAEAEAEAEMEMLELMEMEGKYAMVAGIGGKGDINDIPKKAMPIKSRGSFSIDATGDVVTGDHIRFERDMWGGTYRKPKWLGTEVVTGIVVRDSYGTAKQQHTFTIEYYPKSGYGQTRIKGRNLYKHGVMRKAWRDESQRDKQADEKHGRGKKARGYAAVRKANRGY